MLQDIKAIPKESTKTDITLLNMQQYGGHISSKPENKMILLHYQNEFGFRCEIKVILTSADEYIPR